MPEISIIVPVYNVEKYLRRCVDCILVQIFRNLEYILIDDGVPDNVWNSAIIYTAKDTRIHVVPRKTPGLPL